ncbi:LuxR C-terminal-related transcriptional regulator [Burkholderia anthina]|uniref:LuxR C-terminal-related transcriptional regulator n=1 Tax=Burkholderia anthina TaxID=179879 RepID=UPI00158F0B14
MTCRSARACEVPGLCIRGHTLRAIAEKPRIGRKIVANHRSTFRRQLDVDNSVQLARMANRFDLSFPPVPGS